MERLLDPAYREHIVDLAFEPTPRARTAAVYSKFIGTLPFLMKLQDNPVKMWTNDISKYLKDLISADSRQNSPPNCHHCKERAAQYRCKDCFSSRMYCQQCSVTRHTEHPFHRMEVFQFDYSCSFPLLHPFLGVEWHFFRVYLPQTSRLTRSARPPTRSAVRQSQTSNR